jgi:hypothetical protein
MAKRRRKLDRSVSRKVVLIVGGKPTKTVKTRISMAQAIREIGRDPVGTEGRLIGGRPWPITKTITKSVRVRLIYEADPTPVPDGMQGYTVGINTADAVMVARGNMIL